MSKEYSHTIQPPVTKDSAQLPLRLTLTARFDNDGSLDVSGLAVNGHIQSPKNRTALHRILRGPCRDEMPGGDYVGAGWYEAKAVQIWDKDYTWKLTAQVARAVADEIDQILGRWSREMEPKPTPASTPDASRIAELEKKVAELECANRKLVEMNAFLKQYAPR